LRLNASTGGIQPWLIQIFPYRPIPRDSHGLYAKYGFSLTATPERWMEKKAQGLYAAAGARAGAPDSDVRVK
jgi:hypothetical protein